MRIIQLKDEMLKGIVGGDIVDPGSGGDPTGGDPLEPYETIAVDNGEILVAFDRTSAGTQLDLAGRVLVENAHVFVMKR